MIRKSLLLVTTIGALLLSTQLLAKPSSKGPLAHIFTHDMDLDKTQYQTLKQLHKLGKTHRQMKKDRKGEHLEWLETYAEGEISNQETLTDISESVLEKQVMQNDKLELMFTFVDTLSDEQKQQALENLDLVKDKHAKRIARKETAMNRYDGKRKLDFLFEDMNLSTTQQQYVQDIHDAHVAQKKVLLANEKNRISHLEKIISGNISLNQAVEITKIKLQQGISSYESTTKKWMALIDAMSEQQKQIFLENIAYAIEMRTRHIEKKRRFNRDNKE